MQAVCALVASLLSLGYEPALYRIEYQSDAQELRPLPQGGLEEAYARISTLESELAELRAQPRPVQTYEPYYPPIESYASKDGNSGVSGSGFYAGFELPILKPHVDSWGGGDSPFLRFGDRIHVVPQVREFDFDISPRVWVGYVGCQGLGVRARWWMFDKTESQQTTVYNVIGNLQFDGRVDGGIELSALDFEITERLCIGRAWEVVLSGGVRYVEFRYTGAIEGDMPPLGPASSSYEDYFHGFGATVAAELRRELCWNLALFTGLRGSILFGDEIFNTVDSNPEIRDLRFEESAIVRPTWELQLGLDWSREVFEGVNFVTRVAGEVQYWDSIRDEFAIGLAGVTVTAGFVR